jgi:transposase InsO family protein
LEAKHKDDRPVVLPDTAGHISSLSDDNQEEPAAPPAEPELYGEFQAPPIDSLDTSSQGEEKQRVVVQPAPHVAIAAGRHGMVERPQGANVVLPRQDDAAAGRQDGAARVPQPEDPAGHPNNGHDDNKALPGPHQGDEAEVETSDTEPENANANRHQGNHEMEAVGRGGSDEGDPTDSDGDDVQNDENDGDADASEEDTASDGSQTSSQTDETGSNVEEEAAIPVTRAALGNAARMMRDLQRAVATLNERIARMEAPRAQEELMIPPGAKIAQQRGNQRLRPPFRTTPVPVQRKIQAQAALRTAQQRDKQPARKQADQDEQRRNRAFSLCMKVLPTWTAETTSTHDYMEMVETGFAIAGITDDDEKRMLFLLSLKANLALRRMVAAYDPQASWAELRQMFITRTRTAPLTQLRQFQNIKKEKNEDINQFITRFRYHATELQVRDDDLIACQVFLNALPMTWRVHVHNADATSIAGTDLGPSLDRVYALARQLAPSLRDEADAPPKEAMGGQKCFFCNKTGHVYAECRKRKRQERHQAQRNTATTTAATPALVVGTAGAPGTLTSQGVHQGTNRPYQRSQRRGRDHWKSDRGERDHKKNFESKRAQVQPEINDDLLATLGDPFQKGIQAKQVFLKRQLPEADDGPFGTPPPPIQCQLRVNGQIITAELDTGAAVSLLDKRFVEDQQMPLLPTGYTLSGADRRMGSHPIAATTCLVADPAGGDAFKHTFAVANLNGTTLLLGRDLLGPLKLSVPVPLRPPRRAVQADVDLSTKEPGVPEQSAIIKQLEVELQANAAIPPNAVCKLDTAELKIRPKEHVPYSRPSPPIPQRLLELAERKINVMLAEGKIEQATATPYQLAFFVLPKLSQNEVVDVRAILDCRPINALLSADTFPIPAIRDLLESLAGATIFSELDISDAFHRLPVRLEDRQYLTFRFGRRQYRYCRAPMGMIHVPAHFQRTMDSLLGELPFARTYIDNVIVASRSVEEHVDHLRQVVNRLTDYNMQLNRTKCTWGRNEIRILGHVLSAEGLRPDPQKIAAITQWAVPKTGKQLQRYLGFVNFIREFIPNCSDMTQPLEAIKKEKTLTAAMRQQVEMQMALIQKHLKPDTLTKFPNFDRPFALMCDASNVAIGAVLYQPDEPGDLPKVGNIIAFFSRNLKNYELGYSVYKKELLALVQALTKWKGHLWAAKYPVSVYTDHKSLIALLTQPLNPILMNWLDLIIQFNLKLYHIAGTRNLIADALSRTISANKAKLNVPPPTQEQLDRMETAHRKGHYGALAMIHFLREDGSKPWPHQRQHVEELVHRCVPCARFRRHRPVYQPFAASSAQAPFARVQLDLITSLSERDVLVVVDTFTGFVILRDLPTKGATDVAKTLMSVFGDFGSPLEIVSDNGSEFINEAVQKLNAFFKIHKLPSVPYTPSRQGKVERAIKTIMESLLKMLEQVRGPWREILPLVQLYYNAKIHQSTGVPPFHLVFGRRPSFTADDPSDQFSVDTWCEHLARIAREIYPDILERIKGAKLKNAIQFASRKKLVHNDMFQRGDLVMVLDPKRSSKILPAYLGPFKIVQMMNDHTYLLRDYKGWILQHTVPSHRLKKTLLTQEEFDAFYDSPFPPSPFKPPTDPAEEEKKAREWDFVYDYLKPPRQTASQPNSTAEIAAQQPTLEDQSAPAVSSVPGAPQAPSDD